MVGKGCIRGVMVFVRSRYFSILITGLFAMVLFYNSTKELQSCSNVVIREEEISKSVETSSTTGVTSHATRKSTLSNEYETTASGTPTSTQNPYKLPDDIDLTKYDRKSWIPERFFTAPKFCNNFSYKFTISHSELCKGKDVFMILTIRSAVEGTQSRQLIRETWGKGDNIPGLTIIRVFLLGKLRSRYEKERIFKENDEHGDIIQADFLDTYHNLPLKSMMAFKWARDYCAHAHYFMISDMDMFVDIFKVTAYLKSLKSAGDSTFALCKVEWTERPYRPRSGNKAAIPESEYSTNEYAPYCWGGAYVASIPVINKLYLASIHTPRIRIDDVWIGIVAARAGVRFPPTSDAYILPWHKRHNMLSHIKYYDGPLMFAAFHGSDTYVNSEIRSNWNRIIEHYKPRSEDQHHKEMALRTKLTTYRQHSRAYRKPRPYAIRRKMERHSKAREIIFKEFIKNTDDEHEFDDEKGGKVIQF